tara:strand:- start:13967 stop:14116 length:150 start_codon:yes stop_codon:yes gene_type:complete
MVSMFVGKLLRKHGLKKLLLLVGDYAVKATKTKKDDKIWKEVKKVLRKF